MQHFFIVTHKHSFYSTQSLKNPSYHWRQHPNHHHFESHLELGVVTFITFDFYVVDLAYGILGADFLTRQGLTVNLTARQLIECVEVERATFHDSVESENGFLTSSYTPPDANLLQTLQSEFPEVFDPSRRSRIIKHSIIASVETATEIPVTTRSYVCRSDSCI